MQGAGRFAATPLESAAFWLEQPSGARVALSRAVLVRSIISFGALAGAARGFVADRRGAVSLEYVVVLATTGMIVGLAILGWGPPLVQSFTFTRALIISPVP